MGPLPLRFVLAESPWPRTGGDRRNSARVGIEGPKHGRLAIEVPLAAPVADGRSWRGGGLVVGADGVMIVASGGRFLRIGLDGRVLVEALIPPQSRDPYVDPDDVIEDPPDAVERVHHTVVAPPVALADGGAVVIAPPDLLVFDSRGVLAGGAYVGTGPDDSGLSPNVTDTGALVLTQVMGPVEWFIDGQVRDMGIFGYDIVPVALFADDAMVISGYAGSRLVCVDPDGARRWRVDMDADMLPAIDADGFVAAGSVNEQRSVIVAPDGSVAGAVDGAAAFAEGSNGDWFARFKTGLSRVRRDGSPVWTVPCEVLRGLRWGAQAPIADAAGRVYVLAPDALLALDADTGAEIFRAPLGGAPRAALALVAPGLCAILLEDRVVLIE